MSAAKPRRLARGLASLIGDPDQSIARAERVAALEPTAEARPRVVADNDRNASSEGERPQTATVDSIHPNADQPRRRFDGKELNELAESIAEKGMLQPILVRPHPDDPSAYQIVAGERRWRAAKQAGLDVVPILVKRLSDREVLEISIVENVQRTNLNPIEEARGYKALIDEFGHTQEEIARAVSKSRPHIANCLRLLQLPEGVIDLITDGKLSAGHARAIASAPNIEELATKIVKQKLSVREAEAMARAASSDGEGGDRPSGGRPPGKDAMILELERAVALALGVHVDIRRGANDSGEVRVRFAQYDQLLEICRRLQMGI